MAPPSIGQGGMADVQQRRSVVQPGQGRGEIDAADIGVVGNRVTVTVQTHVDFTLLGIFVHGDPVEVDASASAEPREEP